MPCITKFNVKIYKIKVKCEVDVPLLLEKHLNLEKQCSASLSDALEKYNFTSHEPRLANRSGEIVSIFRFAVSIFLPGKNPC